MGADKWWSNKYFGRLLSALGGFPVSRGSADREALKRCIAVIEGGEPLVLFPEGERKSGPVVQPLFEGAAYLAMRTGVPIVPVGIGGSERVMPKGAKFIYPRKLRVIVGPPLRAPAAASPKEQRAATRQLTIELHAELQRLFDQADKRRAADRTPGAGEPGGPRRFGEPQGVGWCRTARGRECMLSCGTPTSTVAIPNLVAVIGPMVLPHGMLLRLTNTCHGTPAASNTRCSHRRGRPRWRSAGCG